ncbi:29987_t:CDS:2, partial [Racocetra persica]
MPARFRTKQGRRRAAIVVGDRVKVEIILGDLSKGQIIFTMKKKNNQIKITVYGYDVETTEEATRLMTEKISQLKLNFSAYWGRLEVGKLLRSQKKREEQLKIKEKKLQTAIKQLLGKREKLQQEEKRINEFTKQLFRKEELFTQQLALSSHKEKTIREEMEKVKEIRERAIGHLEKIIPLSKEEAKKDLLILLRAEEEKIRQSERIAKEESAKIICQALEKCSSELVLTKTTDALRVESPQIISKIIGKDGRNINAFHRITGTELIIDKESDELTIQISSFNSLRRAIGLQTLRNLIKEVKFSPLHIEKIYQEVSTKIDELIIKTGNEVVEELGLSDVHPEIIKHLGKLKYRTSYGQNVLEHCLEVAKLAGSIAAELDLDVLLARRAGLFHDIGKAVEDGGNYSHVRSGISLAKKFQEPEIVINAIASHHRDFPPTNLYSLIVLAADKLSAARPGVRGYQSEAYIERMNSLENIANNFPGIKKSYAFQAGRE